MGDMSGVGILLVRDGGLRPLLYSFGPGRGADAQPGRRRSLESSNRVKPALT